MAEDTSVAQDVVDNDDDIPDIPLLQMDAPNEEAQDDTADTGKDDAADDSDTTDDEEQVAEGEKQPDENQTAETDEEAAKRQHNDEMARQRIQNRQRTQSDVAKDLNEVYGPKSQEELVAEGKTQEEARYEALEQRLAHNEEVNRISSLNADMTMQSAAILQESAVYNPNSPEYDKDFTDMVDQMYYKQANIQTQQLPDGRQVIVNADIPLDDFYKQMADIRDRGVTKGSQMGQQQAMQSYARTENIGGSSTSGTQGNSLEDLEERLGDMPIT